MSGGRSTRLALGAACAWLALAPVPGFAIDITACGQVVPRGEVGHLRSDLACGPVGPGVRLEGRATLHLNGFTIAGPGTAENGGVSCGRRCRVIGPGQVSGFGVGVSGISIRITDVTVRGNDEAGVSIIGGVLVASNVVAEENGIGIFVPGGRRLVARDVRANDNVLAGLWASGAKVKLLRIEALRNGRYGGVFLARNRRPKPRLVDSVVLDNDGLGGGYDVLAMRPGVRVIGSTCGRGARVEGEGGSDTLTVVGALACLSD